MDAQHIGDQVRHWRLKRGISQRTLAGLAGFTQGYISQIEAGTVSVDKRSTQVAIAQALQVSVADLTGQPYDPRTIEHSTATAAIPRLRAVLMSMALNDRADVDDSSKDLRQEVADAMSLHNACRYDQLLPMLPDLLRRLDACSDVSGMRERLVWATYSATFAAKYLGYPDLAILASQQCRASAARFEDPAWSAVAEFALLNSLPHETGDVIARRANSVINELEPASSDPRVAQVYGMLQLTAALCGAVGGRTSEALVHLDEAEQVARRTGEANFAQMWFGPTNVAIWRVGIFAELQEGARANQMADVTVTHVGPTRQATFYADLGRCLAQVRGREEQAVAALLRAESITPQRVRLSPAVREAVGAMTRRARLRAGGSDLRGLAKRLGTFE